MPGGRGFSAIFPGILTQNFARLPSCGLLNLPTLLPWRIVGNIVKSLRKLASSLLSGGGLSIHFRRPGRAGRPEGVDLAKQTKLRGEGRKAEYVKVFEGRIKRQFVEINWIQIHGK